MTVFVVAYDLRNESGSTAYHPLWDALKESGAFRTQDSLWLVNFDRTAREVHDYLKGFMDDDDRLWVSELTKKHWFSNAKAGTNTWLKENPPAR